ncbi:pseudouridine synthase [Baffinella frigidus]|nr:pseudouridine synthase [Cryptophyta sp. CCMP2293]
MGLSQQLIRSALRPSVLAETAAWIAINKPPMWHSVAPGLRRRVQQEDPPRFGGSVEEWLRETRPELEGVRDAGLVQRLDFVTSGCMLAAKDTASRAALEEQIMSHEGIRKKYLVLVEGDVDTLGSRFELFFAGRYRGSSKVSVSSRISPRARPGSCTWSTIHQTVLETGGGQTVPVSALEVELIGPGSRHQIRAGFAHMRWPIVGYEEYGGSRWEGVALGRARHRAPRALAFHRRRTPGGGPYPRASALGASSRLLRRV